MNLEDGDFTQKLINWDGINFAYFVKLLANPKTFNQEEIEKRPQENEDQLTGETRL